MFLHLRIPSTYIDTVILFFVCWFEDRKLWMLNNGCCVFKTQLLILHKQSSLQKWKPSRPFCLEFNTYGMVLGTLFYTNSQKLKSSLMWGLFKVLFQNEVKHLKRKVASTIHKKVHKTSYFNKSRIPKLMDELFPCNQPIIATIPPPILQYLYLQHICTMHSCILLYIPRLQGIFNDGKSVDMFGVYPLSTLSITTLCKVV